MENENFGLKLRQMRQARGWSVDKLARQASVKDDFIVLLETGVRVPSDETRKGLAKAFGMSLKNFERKLADGK